MILVQENQLDRISSVIVNMFLLNGFVVRQDDSEDRGYVLYEIEKDYTDGQISSINFILEGGWVVCNVRDNIAIVSESIVIHESEVDFLLGFQKSVWSIIVNE